MKDNLKSFADEIGFKTVGTVEGNSYIITLPSSDDYARAYTLLDHFEDLELTEKSSMSSDYSTILVYENESYTVILNGNFNDDTYTITIKEV